MTEEVENIFVIDNGADLTTGECDHEESIQVNGDVQSEVVLSSGKDIIVEGNVADAKLTAKGEIRISGTFSGSGQGILTSGLDAKAESVENQLIRSGRNVIIEKSILHSDIVVDERVEVVKGSIIGGVTSARLGIKAANLGSVTGTKTLVKIGFDVEDNEKLVKLETKISVDNANLQNLVKAHKLFSEILLLKGRLDSNQEKIFKNVKAAIPKVRKENELFVEKLTDLNFNLNNEAQIDVTHKVYKGVTIQMGKQKVNVEEDAENIRFQLSGDRIVAVKNKEKEITE